MRDSFGRMFSLIFLFLTHTLQQSNNSSWSSVQPNNETMTLSTTAPHQTTPPVPSPVTLQSQCHNTSVWAKDKNDCVQKYELYIFLILEDPGQHQEVANEHITLIKRILDPCVKKEAGTENSLFTFLPQHVDGFLFTPISKFADFNETIRPYMNFTFVFKKDNESLELAIESFGTVLARNTSDNISRKTSQKVIYFITNLSYNEIKQTRDTFWNEIEDFAYHNTDDLVAPVLRFIFTEEELLDNVSKAWFDTIKSNKTVRDYIDYDARDLLYMSDVSDDYGLCSPLPTSPLPRLRKSHEMSPIWIVAIALSGTFLFICTSIICMCTFCRRYCWCPDLGGISWTGKDLRDVLTERIQEETDRFRYQVRRPKDATANDYYSKSPENGWRKDKHQPRMIDEWEVSSTNLQIFEEKLGSGAYAVVYKGHLKGIPPVAKVYPSMQLSYVLSNEANYVAVKTTHEYATHEERLEFLQEIRFMKQLEYHPHILSLIGCSTAPNYPLILTEICEFGDLLTLVRNLGLDYKNLKSVLEFNDLVPIGWQISDALTFLSDKKIIHRDVAARNVLVTKNKMAKLSDFGLCRFNQELFYHSRGGKMPIKWMAPESIEFAQFSTKSDVWSFGVLLYEMYSFGKTPFHSINQDEVLKNLKSGGRLELPESSPDWIKLIIESCWKENSADRPEFPNIRQRFYREMEENSECYGYLHFSRNYYQVETIEALESIKL